MTAATPIKNPSPESPATFEGMGLSALALSSLARIGFQHPTPIQAGAIPPALLGRDVIGCAATGTGKSAAFILPMLERLTGKTGTRGLILAPTRELAHQIAVQVEALGRSRNIRAVTIIGGMSIETQTQTLRQKPAIIVATPGRLVDHIQQRTADLSGIEVLVLDEADRMLDMGFRPQLTRILARLPRERQTMLFSATIAGEVAEFAKLAGLRDAVRVEVSRSGTTPERAEQRVYLLGQNEKLALLLMLLEQEPSTTLVFTRTKHRADKVARVVERAGHTTARLHSNRSQSQRRQALEGFRAGKYRVLIATDIAARGLDVQEIGHVVNFDPPHVPEDYVHRIGRTARAAASGRATTLVAPEERGLLTEIERFTRRPIPRSEVDRNSELFQRELARSAASQAHPGPRRADHGVSGRPQGQGPGRHARTHRKPATAGAGASSPPASSGGTWRPRRRRSA
jgi:ATP-dependent RNA helicase RhlE